MKSIKLFAVAMTAASVISACDDNGKNYLLSDTFETPHNVPPFEEIRYRDYEPAFEEALVEVGQTIDLIVANRNEATFENTIIPFDRRNEKLSVLENIFFNVKETDNCDTLAVLASKILPKLSEASDNVYMNDALFARIKHVYDNMSTLDSTKQRVVAKYYKKFVRKGALLSDADKATLRDYNKQIALLSLDFGNNMLAETNAYRLVIDSVADLKGLPDGVIAMAAEKAEKAGLSGKWLFTLHNSSIMPFLQYSEMHDLRKEIYEAYTHRCNNGNAQDNKQNVLKIANLRAKRAKLLGYPTHAHYVIEENMAKTPEAVDTFLTELWTASLKKAKNELNEMKQFAYRYDRTTNIEACDWAYWADKVRNSKYGVDEKEVSEYLVLQNVQKGMFDLANKLYGISVKKATDMPLYNPICEVYEIYEQNGDYVGLIYFDYYPRASKSGGAWCTSFHEALDNFDGTRTPAQVSIVYNFTQPTADTPALLTIDEVETMFHEFGHALHGLFSSGKYRATCGVVPRDYVELPSQIMENWSTEPEVLKTYARHYKTGEIIPDELIAKLKTASTWNKGFAAVEYLATSILDLKWHSISADTQINDVEKFENEVLESIGAMPEIGPRYHTTYLAHSFNGGYDAGYYVYKWAALLDADAYGAFKESGDLYNKELADKFRKYCLSEIGDDDPMEQYVRFRGAKPSVEYLLVREGLKEKK